MSVILQIFDKASKKTSQAKVRESDQVGDDIMDPLMVWKLLLDKNSPGLCGIRDRKRNKNCIFDLSELRNACVKTMKFIFRFVFTMGILYLSAFIFAYLEHAVPEELCENNQDSNVSSVKANQSGTNFSSLRSFLNSMDNITFTECDLNHLVDYVQSVKQRSLEVPEKEIDHLNVQKWFYFVIIATTTIGYGDVCPKTDNGKIFYCSFSVVGIVLMMSLLKSCGEVLTGINKRFHQLVRHFLCPGNDSMSDEFLSIITMTLLFIMYLSMGIAHDSADKDEKHSLVDITYFWIVSLTTVGFGDISHSLEFEIEHAYELTVYRVFGLSLVAGIIESIQGYISLRKETLRNEKVEQKLEAMQKKIMEKVQSAITGSPKDDSHGIMNALQQVSLFSMSTLEEDENENA